MWHNYVPLAQVAKETHRLWEKAVRKPGTAMQVMTVELQAEVET